MALSAVLSRRQTVASGAAAAVLASVSAARADTGAKRLTVGTRIIEVSGRPARVFRLTGRGGRQDIGLDPRERFQVVLANETAAIPSSIGTASSRYGRKTASPGRRHRRSRQEQCTVKKRGDCPA